jgi:hypothetical protein
MLGLGSALTTGSTPEQMYSLALDGTGDLLNIGNVDLIGAGDFSISIWVKTTDTDIDSNYWVAKHQDDDNRWKFLASGQDPPTMQFLGRKGGTTQISEVGSTSLDGAQYTEGPWNHYVVSADRDGNMVYYINGVADSTHDISSDDPATDLGNNGVLLIGSRIASGSGTWAGFMNDVAIFNVALDAGAVAAIYNSGKPFDLNTDRGNYDNASALQGYWKMGNGPFDDKIQGVVHDAHNPGYGAELWDGTDGDDANWVVYASNTKAEDDGAVKITYVDSTNGAKIILKDATDLNTDLTVGATYRLTWDAKVNTSSVKINTTGIINDTQIVVDSTDFAGYTMYMIAESTDADLLFVTHMTTGEIVWIKNISLKKLNGYPGITVADAAFSTDTPDD